MSREPINIKPDVKDALFMAKSRLIVAGHTDIRSYSDAIGLLIDYYGKYTYLKKRHENLLAKRSTEE